MPQAHTRSGRGQQAAADNQSAFLQCLEKLNDDTFCQILLPKLKADGSAGSLAATCSQLRRLCHNSTQRLNMGPLINKHAPSAAGQWTQGLQEHFPHCSSVVLCVQEMRGYHGVNYVLPALARLPKLSSLEFKIEGPPLPDMLHMAMLLLYLRTQLTSLQTLSLELSQGWVDAEFAFAELASMTQLTALSIKMVDDEIIKPCDKADLMQLSKLCRLERLQVDLPVVNAADHPVCFDLVAQLTALTALELTVGSSEGFSSIGNCSNLQELKVTDATEVEFELSPHDWEVVGQLTQLTFLMLWPVVQRTDCVACQLALQQLTALQNLCADAWVPEVLPGLQDLSHLTRLGGGWLPGVGSADPVTCPQIQRLTCSYGEIPCSAFPGLLHITLYGWVPARVLAALSKQCCLLQTIDMDNTSSPTLDFGEPVAERVAALMSLSSLQHLTALSFSVMDNAEMLAVSRVAAVLAKSHKLASVSLVVPVHSGVSNSSLLHVAQLSGLNMLRVQLGPHFLGESDTLQSFACALAVVQDVEVLVSTMQEFDKLSEAFAETSSIGLEVPLHYKVTLSAD